MNSERLSSFTVFVLLLFGLSGCSAQYEVGARGRTSRFIAVDREFSIGS
jgi:hypothetical protein